MTERSASGVHCHRFIIDRRQLPGCVTRPMQLLKTLARKYLYWSQGFCFRALFFSVPSMMLGESAKQIRHHRTQPIGMSRFTLVCLERGGKKTMSACYLLMYPTLRRSRDSHQWLITLDAFVVKGKTTRSLRHLVHSSRVERCRVQR